MVRITWYGHAFFELKGEKIVMIDPWIDHPLSPVRLDDIRECDIICVTHGHGDHLGNAIEISKKTGALIVSIYELAVYAQENGARAEGMNLGGTLEIDGVKVTMVEARHSSDIVMGNKIISGGIAAGFLVEMDGVRIYHAGDTSLFYDMRLIGELYSPDVALLPIGGRYTMGIREAAIATSWIRPRLVIPMHYRTFPQIDVDPRDFERMVSNLCPWVKVKILEPGESIEIEPAR